MLETTKSDKVLANITVPGGAIMIGVVLLLECLAAPFFAPHRLLPILQLILGGFGVLLATLGIVGAWQERLRSKQTGELPTKPPCE